MLFDDMLGNTLGVKDGEKFSAIDRDAFGELKPGEKPNLAVNFFTGKPEIDGLGYSFLLRNYRADLGKWQIADPIGYLDGWNNFAYVNNNTIMYIDFLGAWGETSHHEINYYWLKSNNLDWAGYEWGTLSLNILNEMNDGSDWTDSIWAGNQASKNAYMHAMRSGELADEVADIALAESKYHSHLLKTRNEAMDLSDKAREYYQDGDTNKAKRTMEEALFNLGIMVHTLADSFAPPHRGFQHFSLMDSANHVYAERHSVYEDAYKGTINNYLNGYKFVLDYILQQPE